MKRMVTPPVPSPQPTVPASAPRNIGIDLARGLAVLFMIQTHALDGWISAADKLTLSYRFTRIFSNIPAPLFLLLAGVGLAMGSHSALRRGQPPTSVRQNLLRRGLEVLAYGYLVSLCYSLIEWQLSLSVLLRVDILHCIGLSLMLCSVVLVGRVHAARRALGLPLLALTLGLLLPRLLPLLPSNLPSLTLLPAALLIDVAPYTRFPLLPLCGFTALGFYLGLQLVKQMPTLKQALLVGALALALVWPLQLATSATVLALGGKLSRAHPAVVWNFLEGCCRAVATLYLSLAASRILEQRHLTQSSLLTWLLRLGRGSLLAYAIHIPLCYGRLAKPIAQQLSMPAGCGLLLLLTGFTYLVVWGRDELRARRART